MFPTSRPCAALADLASVGSMLSAITLLISSLLRDTRGCSTDSQPVNCNRPHTHIMQCRHLHLSSPPKSQPSPRMPRWRNTNAMTLAFTNTNNRNPTQQVSDSVSLVLTWGQGTNHKLWFRTFGQPTTFQLCRHYQAATIQISTFMLPTTPADLIQKRSPAFYYIPYCI